MNVLIIYCHPQKDSYTHKVLEHLKRLLAEAHATVSVSDLYASDFQSDMTPDEYQRESAGRVALPIAEDVLSEHEKINMADCIVFVYPVWWSDCPAKLKGWFDRVWSVGFAYKHQAGYERMKIMKAGVVVCTAGYSTEELSEQGIAQSMEKIMLNDRLGNRFAYKEMIILGGTLDLQNSSIHHQKQLEEMILRLQELAR